MVLSLSFLEVSAVMSLLYIKISVLYHHTNLSILHGSDNVLLAVVFILLFFFWLKPQFTEFHGWFYLSFSDRLSTGIVVADIDLSFVDSVREKMPIAKVSL